MPDVGRIEEAVCKIREKLLRAKDWNVTFDQPPVEDGTKDGVVEYKPGKTVRIIVKIEL